MFSLNSPVTTWVSLAIMALIFYLGFYCGSHASRCDFSIKAYQSSHVPKQHTAGFPIIKSIKVVDE